MGIIACYIYDEMAEWEVAYACYVLAQGSGNNRKQIIAVSADGSDIRCCSGLRMSAEARVKDVIEQPGLEGLLIPGGFRHDDCEDLFALINMLHKQQKLLAAICAAPVFLARAGILHDVQYTTTLTKDFFASQRKKDPFPRKNYLEQDIVRHNNVITAKFNAFLEFAAEICDWFGFFSNSAEKTESLRVFKNINSGQTS
jgi:putative intracellular protease/amidase